MIKRLTEFLGRFAQKKGLLYRWLHVLFPAALLVVAWMVRTTQVGLVEEFQAKVFDTYQRSLPRPYKPVPVKIVDLDDDTLARMGQWPWPRTQVAKLVRRLDELGAASISFDIVFAEPDRTSPARVVAGWPSTPDTQALKAHAAGMPDNDRVLAKTLKEAGNVVTGFVLTAKDNGKHPSYRVNFSAGGMDPADFLPPYQGAIINVPELDGAASGHGCFTTNPERDGVIRRVPLLFRCDQCNEQRLVPSLAAESLRVAQRAAGYAIKSQGASGAMNFVARTGIVKVKIGKFVVPTDPKGRLWVHYTRPLPERTIPIWKLFEKDFDRRAMEGAIVFVGTSAEGLKDQRTTPLERAAPGVDIHAQLVEQILTEDFLMRPDLAELGEILFMLVLGLALIFLLPHLGAAWCATLGAACIAGAFAFSWHAYAAWSWLLDPFFPSLAVVAVYISSSLISYLKSETEKKQIRGAFSRYMHPKLVEELAKHPERLTLGGETREMTILFCDIRGFTTISEQFDAHGLTQMINRFLTPMTEIIMERSGYIDKYIGDCIMAFWNAPLDDAEHAKNACRSALAMHARLAVLNTQWEAAAKAAGTKFLPIHIGAGLNSGPCCVGNLGADMRFNYSVLGDDVNLASRLEGQSKAYGVDTVIGPKTRQDAPEFAAVELDLIKVKGKTRPVTIYGLLGDESLAKDSVFLSLAKAHDAMLAAYRAQDWAVARQLIGECRAFLAREGPAHDSVAILKKLYKLYEERVSACEAEPPAKDWDGVFTATSK